MPIALKKKQASTEEKKENFYTREELIEFLNCFKNENSVKAYTLFHLLAYSGMRKGEALGLRWKDINFTENKITISKAISRGFDNRLYEKSTKTGETRIIKMDCGTMNILKEWQKKQKEELLSLGFNKIS